MRNGRATVLVVVLAMPALSFGQGTLGLHGDRVQINPGESFTLTVDLSSDVGLQFGQYLFSVDDGANSGLFMGQFISEGDWFGPGGFLPGSLSVETQLPIPTPLDSVLPEMIFHAGPETTLTGGSLASYVITASGPFDSLTLPQTFSIGLDPEQTIFTNAAGVVGMQITPFEFQVIPEPSSALLLLAGMPLLRRRWP